MKILHLSALAKLVIASLFIATGAVIALDRARPAETAALQSTAKVDSAVVSS